MQPAAPRHVYLNLDAIRGVAAISVMLYHFSPFLAAGKVLPGLTKRRAAEAALYSK